MKKQYSLAKIFVKDAIDDYTNKPLYIVMAQRMLSEVITMNAESPRITINNVVDFPNLNEAFLYRDIPIYLISDNAREDPFIYYIVESENDLFE